MSEPYSATALHRLLTIITRLRDPQAGCHWDKSQTFDSIAPCTLEETYEVLDAIARRDFGNLCAALGDLLFQVVFYAELAREQGRFDFTAVYEAISDKLERRQPHLFRAGGSSRTVGTTQGAGAGGKIPPVAAGRYPHCAAGADESPENPAALRGGGF